MIKTFFCSRIRYQANDYLKYKSEKRGESVACEHKEWILKFIKVTGKRDISEVTMNDFDSYKQWLFTHYASDYMVKCGIYPVRCLLKFYRRHDLLRLTGKDLHE